MLKSKLGLALILFSMVASSTGCTKKNIKYIDEETGVKIQDVFLIFSVHVGSKGKSIEEAARLAEEQISSSIPITMNVDGSRETWVRVNNGTYQGEELVLIAAPSPSNPSKRIGFTSLGRLINNAQPPKNVVIVNIAKLR